MDEAERAMMDNFNSSGNDDSSPGCDLAFYKTTLEFMDFKIPFVLVFGTFVSLVSIFENTLLTYLFIAHPQFRTSYLFYMAVLAVADIVVAINYILLMAIPVLYDVLLSELLYSIWMGYLAPVFSLSWCCITLSSYLVVAATMERYCITIKASDILIGRLERNRVLIVIIICAFAFMVHGTRYFDLAITDIRPEHPNCTLFYRLFLDENGDAQWFTVLKFYIRSVLNLTIPFVLLVFMNICILRKLKKEQSMAIRLRMQTKTSTSKEKLKAATRMLMSVVMLYLIANVLSLSVQVWDFVTGGDSYNYSGLKKKVYSIISDVTSQINVLAGCLRLPIYCHCSAAIKNETIRILTCFQRTTRTGSQTSLGSFASATNNLHTEDDEQETSACDGAKLITVVRNDISTNYSYHTFPLAYIDEDLQDTAEVSI